MNFYILSADEITAKWENNRLTVINEALAPMYIVNTGNVERWLETRAIDSHRANSRLIKKALRIAEKDDISVVLSVNAATITDNYWIKPIDSSLTYEDVRFDSDYFASLALKGGYDSFNKAVNSRTSKTPELTNTGSFEKCWKLTCTGSVGSDGNASISGSEWWMHKSANHNEQFSEIFIYELGKHLGFNMAEYVRGDKCVKTKDFTHNASVSQREGVSQRGGVTFEPAYSFMNDDEDYINVVKKLRIIAPHAIGDYVRMIFMDTICANPDRHTFNFGLLRDVRTGEILSLAPNFDNNIALISRGYPSNINRKNDALVRFMTELIDFDPSLRKYIPKLTEDDIRAVLQKVNMKVKSDTIIRFIMNGYTQI